jgi:hypothetical protein
VQPQPTTGEAGATTGREPSQNRSKRGRWSSSCTGSRCCRWAPSRRGTTSTCCPWARRRRCGARSPRASVRPAC